MDFTLAHFVNQLGHGVIDPFTDLVCEVPLLVALWLLLPRGPARKTVRLPALLVVL